MSLHPASLPPTFPQPRHSFWLSFPSSSSTHIFTTLGLRRGDGIREAVIAGIANGLSREGMRFDVANDRFVARTLESMVYHRGGVEGGGAGGCLAGWSIYGDGFETNPLALPKEVLLPPPGSDGTHAADGEIDAEEERARKRRKRVADARFGPAAIGDGRAIESVTFRLEERFPESLSDLAPARDGDSDDGDGDDEDGVWRPDVTITFEGSHVFAGLKEMAERGEGVLVEKLPGWMVGEAGVTSGVVRGGVVQGLENRGGVVMVGRGKAKAKAS